jgi:hypothetical protein
MGGCVKHMLGHLGTDVFKTATNPESVKPAIGAFTVRAYIAVRGLAILFTILGNVGAIENFPKQGLVRDLKC